jgi:hypothetical protein
MTKKQCLWCERALRAAPTRRWWLSSEGKHVCYECALRMAELVLKALQRIPRQETSR